MRQKLARHPLISSCFSWNHGRRGCQGPGEEKSRNADEVKFIDTDEVKWRHAGGMTQSPMGGMLPHVTQHAEEIEKDRSAWTKRDQHLVEKKKAINGWGPTEDGTMTRHPQTVMSISIRRESMLEMRKSCPGTKEKQFAISRIDTFSQ